MAYLGVDPGREKIGWVLADSDGRLICSGILPVRHRQELQRAVRQGNWRRLAPFLAEGGAPEEKECGITCIVVGDGTGSAAIQVLFAGDRRVQTVPEGYSTLEARSLYWRYHPPRGIRRLIPRSLCVPPRPIDDFAALYLVRRHLAMQP